MVPRITQTSAEPKRATMPQTIDLKAIFEHAGGYAPDAYAFIRDGLAHTVESVHGADGGPLDPEDDSRHVDGRQLCLGLSDYALQRYGLLAKPVLHKWGIHETLDFGKIIFALVDAGLMRKTDDDTLDDFDHVYDFDEIFAEPESTMFSEN